MQMLLYGGVVSDSEHEVTWLEIIVGRSSRDVKKEC